MARFEVFLTGWFGVNADTLDSLQNDLRLSRGMLEKKISTQFVTLPKPKGSLSVVRFSSAKNTLSQSISYFLGTRFSGFFPRCLAMAARFPSAIKRLV